MYMYINRQTQRRTDVETSITINYRHSSKHIHQPPFRPLNDCPSTVGCGGQITGTVGLRLGPGTNRLFQPWEAGRGQAQSNRLVRPWGRQEVNQKKGRGHGDKAEPY